MYVGARGVRSPTGGFAPGRYGEGIYPLGPESAGKAVRLRRGSEARQPAVPRPDARLAALRVQSGPAALSRPRRQAICGTAGTTPRSRRAPPSITTNSPRAPWAATRRRSASSGSSLHAARRRALPARPGLRRGRLDQLHRGLGRAGPGAGAGDSTTSRRSRTISGCRGRAIRCRRVRLTTHCPRIRIPRRCATGAAAIRRTRGAGARSSPPRRVPRNPRPARVAQRGRRAERPPSRQYRAIPGRAGPPTGLRAGWGIGSVGTHGGVVLAVGAAAVFLFGGVWARARGRRRAAVRGQLFDAALAPAVGGWSDRAVTRFGRRRAFCSPARC